MGRSTGRGPAAEGGRRGRRDRLTVVRVRAARHPGTPARPIRIADGSGSFLQVTPTGAKSRVVRYRRQGRLREMGLGPCGDPPEGIGLAEARKRAAKARALLLDGRDPIEERCAERRRAAGADRSFAAAARALLAAERAGWRNAEHAAQRASSLER